MLSALIRPRRGYPAVHLAVQPAHRRSVQHGPLVLVSDPRKSPAPTTDRDRTVSRRSEPSSRATLIGEQPNPWDLLQPRASGLQLLLATAAFAFQIYGDFGGYSHIAIGAAKVLGYDLMENFRQPYFAVSVRDFWRRWHISLSTWFRDYVYIPLGGSRVGAFRRALNVMVTFTISGLWHGAAMNYVAWGAANGALQVAESFLPRRFNEPRGRLGRCAKALLTFIVIDATWLLFRAHALSTALHMAERMVRCAAVAPMATGFTFPQALVLVVGLAALGALDALHERGRTLTAWLDRRPAALRMALMLLGVLLVVIFGVWGTNYDAQAFIYFQF